MTAKSKQNILLFHGIILCLIGLLAAIATTLGRIKGIGPFNFLQENKMVSIGLFEAYLLAAVCGCFLILGSQQPKREKFHLMGCLIHVPLLVTNLIYWKFYEEVGMETMGIVSTIAHFFFIGLELFLGLHKNKS